MIQGIPEIRDSQVKHESSMCQECERRPYSDCILHAPKMGFTGSKLVHLPTYAHQRFCKSLRSLGVALLCCLLDIID